eukprot:XP_011669612.1 PREDICTED: serine/threonine-protein phosphatase 6 regulatory ankyrin repeat subunit B-like [Strongylocentrotus purpuratus]
MGDRNGYTPLHFAAMKGDLDIVKVLIEEEALVDVRDANGQTPLHLSSKKGTANFCDLLAEHAKINGTLDYRDDEGLTAIHLATQNGHTPVVESLVSHGSSLNIQSHDGKTCLHEAIILSAHTSRTEQTKARSQQISEDFNRQELFRKKAALVLYILEHGGKTDIRDVEGKLPIHYATNEVIRQMIFSRLPSIEMITRYRAEDAKPLFTVSAHVGNGGKQIELADLGISMIIPPGAIKGSGSCEITLTSIQDLPSIDSQGDESLACLGIRCEPLNMIFHQPVKIKIPHSAVIVNPNQVKPDIVCRSWDSVKDLPRTSRNRSSSSPDEPPYCKVYKRHFELYIGHCAEWLVLIPLEQQVIRHQLMCTPYIPETVGRGKEFEVHLQMHADVPGMDLYGQETVTEYLINHGADVEKATPDGQTPLHHAASLGHLKASTILLSHGANMDIEDNDGCSALYSAVMNGHLNVVRYFISQGEKVKQGNTKGWTPLYIAAGMGKLDMSKYLISQGAEVNKRDSEDATALHFAAQGGSLMSPNISSVKELM